MDGDGENEEFYPRSALLRVTLEDTEPGQEYMVRLAEAEGETTCFIDQRGGGYPSAGRCRRAL